MKTRVSPTLVGIFVLGALLLAIIAIVSFGGVNLFTRPQRFVVCFDESTNGLDLGSPVKFRGVRVGRVVDMNVLYDEATKQSHVIVVCEFNRNIIVDAKGVTYDASNPRRLQAMVNHGLRAELDLLGLATGLLYVELDFVPPTVVPPAPPSFIGSATGNYVVIPAKPSAISTFQTNITDILGELKNMDLAGIARDADALLKDARQQLNALDLPAMTAEITRAGKSVSDLAGSAEVRKTLADLDATLNQLRDTLTRLDTTLNPASGELPAVLSETQTALKKFSAAADSAKRFMDSNTGLGENASTTLRQINEAAASVQRLMDYLERNPNALISGKKPSQ